MKRVAVLAAAAVAVAACSSSQPKLAPSTVAPPTRIYAEPGGGSSSIDFQRTVEDRAVRYPMARSPEQAWPTLVALYQEMGVPVTALDEKTFTIGSQATARRRLLDAPLAQWVDCGYGGATRAPLANSYEVTLQLSSALRPAGEGGSQVMVMVRGWARDPVHGGAAIACSTTGRLEQHIARRLGAQVPAA